MFNLADVLSSVPKMDTAQERIEYIPIKYISPDPRNFYELSGIDELAANIELLGLQQPLRLRPDPMTTGRFYVVSGHRRLEALKLLAADKPEKWAAAPCIVEDAEGSEAMQELRLIYANSDTRRMTSFEVSRQAERVEALLYELKEAGVEFPGRMRDHVAEACKVSKSKLARLKVIRDNLLPEWLPLWQSGSLSESVAYAIAQATPEDQEKLKKYRLKNGKPGANFTECDVKNFYGYLEQLSSKSCPAQGGTCVHPECALNRYAAFYSCGCFERCCLNCSMLTACSYSCPLAAERKTERIAAEEAAEEQRVQEREALRRAAVALRAERVVATRAFFSRLAAAMPKNDITTEELMTTVGYIKPDDDEIAEIDAWLDGDNNAQDFEAPGDFLDIEQENLDKLVNLADLLGCSIDYLLGRTVEPDSASPKWRSGSKPPKDRTLAWCLFDCGGTQLTQEAEYQPFFQKWTFPGSGVNIDADCLAWHPLPDADAWT